MSLTASELFQMFQAMRIPITENVSRQIFESVDFDQDGCVTMPEFTSDFQNTV